MVPHLEQFLTTRGCLQMLSTLVFVANTTYSEAAGAQLQLNNYSSCSSAPEVMLSTPPPPATPPPPGSIGSPVWLRVGPCAPRALAIPAATGGSG